MNCPVCHSPLVIIEKCNIELDWCPECGGLWFDADEWRLLGVNDEKYNPFSFESVKVDEKARKCPVCNKTMDKIQAGDTLLDRCPNFHGVWFDKHELSSFINYSNSEEISTKTVKFLGEVFNIKRK